MGKKMFHSIFSPSLNASCNLLSDNYVLTITTGVENLRLPQGTNLIINLFGLHRKKEIWGENAEKFDPENFHPDKINERHNYSFLPFANGTRLCIGNFQFSIFLHLFTSIHYLIHQKSFQEIVMR